MDLVAALIAWLDWQSDRYIDVTAMAAVVVVNRDVTGEESWWWSAHPVRTQALVRAVLHSGWCRHPGFAEWDYDVRDLRNFCNHCRERTLFEVKWTLNRIRDRRWGVIP